MNIIILAAGNGKHRDIRGSRSLLSLNGETVLGRQIRIFHECGLDEIHVVISYEKEKIMKKYPDLTYIISKHEDERGAIGGLYSLLLTKHLWKDTLVFNGDTVFFRRTLHEILNAPLNELGLCFIRETKGVGMSAFKMNNKGATLLKNIKEPFASSVNPKKNIYFRNVYLAEIFNVINLHWHKKIYSAISLKNFIMDIDSMHDYEIVKGIIQ